MSKSQPGAIAPDAYNAVYELVNAVLSYQDATTPGLQAHPSRPSPSPSCPATWPSSCRGQRTK